MKQVLLLAALIFAAGLAGATLPAPSEAAKAKAAETAAKAAWQGKVDAYQTCKVQDKIAAQYKKTSGGGPGKPEPSPKPDQPAAAAPAPAPAASLAASGTPVAWAPPPPCAEPGPFSYDAPAEKPLETSGAHSPAGNATSPPSVKSNSAEMAPAKK